MTTIRATCPTCGEVELTPDDIELRVCSYAPASSYHFDCPVCHVAVQKAADDRVVQLLISGGVAVVAWSLPDEAAELRSGPPISFDDVLDFHLLMERSDWFDHLLRVSA